MIVTVSTRVQEKYECPLYFRFCLFTINLSIALQYEDKTPSGNKSKSTEINEFEI